MCMCTLTIDYAQIGFFRGDIKGLMADVQALRPTIFPSVPRLLNKLYDKVVRCTVAVYLLKLGS